MINKTINIVFATIVMMLISITVFAESKDNAIMELTRQDIPISEKSLENFIEKGDIRVVNLLIDAGLSPNSKCADGYPILSFAVLSGKTDIAKSLIARGANVNAEGPRTGRNPSGYNAGGTPIFFAAMTGNTEILKLLIAKGADVNAKMTVGMTPLMFAANNGHANAVKILISNGADLNAKSINGQSALDYATKKGNTQIVKILREAMSDVEDAPVAPETKARPTATWSDRAVAFQKAQDWQGLLAHSRRWTQAEPDNYLSWFSLGVAYEKGLGRYSEAIEAYREALLLKPDHAATWFNLGVAYQLWGRKREAIEAYREALRLKPDYAKAWSNLGVAYAELGRNREAIEAYRESVRLRPDDVNTWRNLANAYAKSGNRSAALEAVRELRRYDPQEAEKLFNNIVKP